jgi:hypothetical protein
MCRWSFSWSKNKQDKGWDSNLLPKVVDSNNCFID